jgi:LPS export ABC transporter protein LptC/lipopolysaccharide transport protein LptA
VKKQVFIFSLVLLLVFQWFYYSSNKSYKAYKAKLVEATSQDETPAVDENGKPKEKKVLEEQKAANLYLFEAKKNVKESELWSKMAHKPMGSNEWNLDGVKAQFYSENVTYIVFGDKGQVDEVKKNMLIEGHVKIDSSNGYHFYTDHLNYDPEGKRITTSDKVSLEGPHEREGRLYLEGYGLNINLISNVMVMQNKVSGYKPMSEGRVMKIASQSAEFSAKQRSVAFKNNVVIRQDKMVVRGNLATFQYKDGKLDTLHMEGGIHMSDIDKTGSSGEALVYFNEDKYIFRQKPFITQSENALIGDEIIIFNGGKRVQVKKAQVEYFQTDKPEKKPTSEAPENKE